jgi:hypothetical protein
LWATWVCQHANIASLEGELVRHHWTALRGLLPLYRAITMVQLGNGAGTSFWHDVWYEDDCLADRFPTLLSHCKSSSHTVQEIFAHGLEGGGLVSRLTPIARQELAAVNQIMDIVTLSGDADTGLCPFVMPDGKLRTGPLYKLLLAAQGVESPISKVIWKNKAPPRVQFFAWLLTQGRVQCRANLPKKNIVQEANCEECGAAEETATHIIFQCPFAQDFWRALRFTLPADARVATLDELSCPDHVPNM